MKNGLILQKIGVLFIPLLCSGCMSDLSTHAETSPTPPSRAETTIPNNQTPETVETSPTQNQINETTVPNPNNQKPKGKTPQELGKEYPKLVRQAKDAVTAMQPDMQIKFPLGVNYPISINIKKGEKQNNVSRYEIIGFVDKDKKPKPMSTNDLLQMLEQHLKQINNPRFSQSSNKSTDKNLVAEAINDNSEKKVAVLDIIAVKKDTNKVFMIPNVAFISILRDAINAALNKEIKPNNHNVSRLNVNPALQQN